MTCLSSTIDGPAIVAALGGRWRGREGFCRCPAHLDRTPSLHVTETPGGRILVHCFAGCPNPIVVDELKARGLWYGDARPLLRLPKPVRILDDRARVERAIAIWKAARPISGTLAEAYLRERGIRIGLPPSLRYHPELKHGPSGRWLPALVAAVQDADRHVLAIHRTFLEPTGGQARVERPKLALAPLGAGAVRLGAAGRRLGLAEGVETGLSAMQLYGVAVWCSLGTGRLAKLTLPDIVKTVVVYSDTGVPGQEAAALARSAYHAQGRRVLVAYPPAGNDFNDVLEDAA